VSKPFTSRTKVGGSSTVHSNRIIVATLNRATTGFITSQTVTLILEKATGLWKILFTRNVLAKRAENAKIHPTQKSQRGTTQKIVQVSIGAISSSILMKIIEDPIKKQPAQIMYRNIG
jgi:hypothetical protein